MYHLRWSIPFLHKDKGYVARVSLPILPLSWGTCTVVARRRVPSDPFPTFRSVSLFSLPIILPEISSFLPTQHTRARGGRRRKDAGRCKGKAEGGGVARRGPSEAFLLSTPPQEQGGEGNDGTQKRRNARAKCKGERSACGVWGFLKIAW